MILEQISKLTAESQQVLEKLGLPSNLPKDFCVTKIIETHLSLLLIGKDLVWKFKKPLTLEFVDHSNIQNRWTSAHAEVFLNRRLTVDIYLGVIPFSHDGFQPLPIMSEPASTLPEGIAEVAVVMKTLPEEAMLSSLIKSDSVDRDRHVRPLGERLAKFHQNLSPVSFDEAQSTVDNFQKACLANFATISELLTSQPRLLEDLRNFTISKWPAVKALLLERGKNGNFIDGHGDLRSEHIVYTDGEVSAIDCLEFSASLRVNDWLADIAFLKMDLEFLRRTDLWRTLYKEYSSVMRSTSDTLLYYFAIYRALVRCKVELLSDLQGLTDTYHKEQAFRYLGLASRFRYEVQGPLILVTCGISGTGKSTLAGHLSRMLAAIHIESDRVRRSLFSEPENQNVKFGQGKYSEAGRQSVYNQIFQEVEKELKREEIVIVDGSFSSRSYRVALQELAQSFNSPVYWLKCQLDLPELQRRIVSRQQERSSTFSESRIELLESQIAAFEPFDGAEGGVVLDIDTAQNVENIAQQFLKGFQN